MNPLDILKLSPEEQAVEVRKRIECNKLPLDWNLAKRLQKEALQIGKMSYMAEIGSKQGWVREFNGDGEKKYLIAHVMGGKNVYYFLTPMEKGRLQVLPLAYNVHKAEWFDTAASGVRHFPGIKGS